MQRNTKALILCAAWFNIERVLWKQHHLHSGVVRMLRAKQDREECTELFHLAANHGESFRPEAGMQFDPQKRKEEATETKSPRK